MPQKKILPVHNFGFLNTAKRLQKPFCNSRIILSVLVSDSRQIFFESLRKEEKEQSQYGHHADRNAFILDEQINSKDNTDTQFRNQLKNRKNTKEHHICVIADISDQLGAVM